MTSEDPAISGTPPDLHVDRPLRVDRPAGEPAELTVEQAAEPTDADGGSTRERILVAASELFARRGYHGTSTRAMADAVGIRQPSMFHHFRSKSAVMKELLDIAVTPSHKRVSELAADDGSAAERLARYLLEDAELLVSSRFNLLGLTTDDVLAEAEFDDWRAVIDALRGDRRRLLQQGVDAGEFVPVDLVRGQIALDGALTAGLGALRARPAEDADAALDELIFLVLRMLMRQPERAAQVVADARARLAA